jgi:hypothetical protein
MTAAMLHQRQRDRLPDGEIIARIEDYAAAHALLAPVFDAISSDGLTPAIRQTVEAVNEGEEDITIVTLMERLNLEKSSVWYRVRKACAGGWLVNDETRQGQPARLQRGDSLPECTSTLPLPDAVAEEAARISVSTDSGVGYPPPPSSASSEDHEVQPDQEAGLIGSSQENGTVRSGEGGGGPSPQEELIDTLTHGSQTKDNGHAPDSPSSIAPQGGQNVCADCGASFPAEWLGFYCEKHGGQSPYETEPNGVITDRPQGLESDESLGFEQLIEQEVAAL